MAGALIYITDAGRAALVAPGNAGTNAHTITQIGLSTGLFDPSDSTLTKLPKELKRITTFSGENVAFDTIHVTLRDDTADQYTLYGFGLYLENGVLAGVYCQNAADGPIMEKAPAAMLLLSADVQFTTIDAAQLVFGNANFTNPPATTERQGVVELATQAEVNAGTDNLRAITPKTAAARYAALTGADFTGPVTVAGATSKISAIGTPVGSALFAGYLDDKAAFLLGTDGAINGGMSNFDTSLYTYGAHNQRFYTNGYERMRIDANGRVLIGKTDYDSLGSTLQVIDGISTRAFYAPFTAIGDPSGAAMFRGWLGESPAFVLATDGAINPGPNNFDTSLYTYGAFNQRFYTNGAERLRITSAGRSLFGTTTDDGTNLVQIGGNASTRGVHTFGYGATTAYASADATVAYFRSNGHVSVGSEAAAGFLDLVAGNTARARILPSGRFLIGLPAADDGVTLMQVAGNISAKRLVLGEGSPAFPSLTFNNDDASDTGLYHINDGAFGVSCNGVSTVRFTPTTTYFDKPAAGQHPPTGDASNLLPTTAWVVSALASASIGQIVMEPRTTSRAGFLKANGATLNRADYPGLWAYAQASGALVTETQWSNGNWGCFSSGDGATTFRVPELRGEHLRCWDDGRGVDGSRAIGSWQDSQNRSHSHGASAGAVGDHSHSAWTDTQGFHGHGVSDGTHSHVTTIPARGASAGQNAGYFGPSGAGVNANFEWGSSASGSNIGINGDGNHAHNIGMNGAGSHSHAITVNADGGAETRVRTVALLAMIRAY